MVSKFPISCDEEDKENSPALGKLVTASLGNVQTPITAQAPHRSSLAPRAGGVDPTPCMTPHALQFRVVAVPFWGLQAGAPEALATEEVPIAAATTTAGPLSAGPPTPSGPTPAVAGDLSTAAAGLLPTTSTRQVSSTIAAAKRTRPRGSKGRTASAPAPGASQMVTRSQAAAQKHVERMQARSRQCRRM